MTTPEGEASKEVNRMCEEMADSYDNNNNYDYDEPGNGDARKTSTDTGEQQQQEQQGENSTDKNTKNKSNKILEFICEEIQDLFVDEHDVSFAAVRINNHIEILPIRRTKFKRWICQLHYEIENSTINGETLAQVCNYLDSKAMFSNNIKTLDLRISSGGSNDKAIYYDLTNKSWQVIKITQHNWSVEESTSNIPIMFTRYTNQIAQIYPSPNYPSDIFDQFMKLINVKDEDNRLLLKCYIISLFIPGIPKPVLMLHGEQGSAKSTLQELIKMLVDPSSIRTLTFTRDINELIQQLSHNYIAYYDNISTIRDWVSDQLCRAVTGSGFSKRELYSDDDDIIYNFKRCLGFNGINLAASKADLLDRGIIIQLERISKENRRKIEEIWTEFERIRPQLLGYIFDILVKVLQIKSSGGINLNSKSRMADFEEYAEIISRCMGNEAGSFTGAYYKNQQLQTEEVIEGSPVATTIVKFMESRHEWEGTATKLLKELETTANELRIDIQSKLWPKAAHVLTRRLNEIRTNLREVGISVDYNRDSETAARTIEIRKIASEASKRQETENHTQNNSKYSDATSDAILHQNNIASGNNPENHVQNQVADAMYASDGIIQISRIECRYCTFLGYDITFCNSDLLERHTIDRHPGWTAYPGPADLEKYKRERKERAVY